MGRGKGKGDKDIGVKTLPLPTRTIMNQGSLHCGIRVRL